MDVELPARRSAADQYRDAFERLKLNRPQLLPKGTRVTQNNVAKEAGSDPSALKKSRFPSLIAEIKTYVDQHAEERPPSLNQVNLLARQKSRALRDRIEEVARQRDQLASLLSEADTKIIELYDRIAELERQLPASNIISLDPRGPRKL
jgi:chromosome segregation ATPase